MVSTRRALFLQQSQREARSSLKRLGVPVDVLAVTRQFTAFAPPAGSTLPALVELLWGSLYEVTSDDHGLRVQFHQPQDQENEVALSIATGKKFSRTDASDIFLGLAGPLEARAAAVTRLLSEPVRRRDELLRKGELLRRLGLPVIELPVEVATGAREKKLPVSSPPPTVVSARPNGHMIHLPMKPAALREALELYSVDAEVVASNPSWSSFVPRAPGFRVDHFIEKVAVRRSSLHVWWDEAFGLQVDLNQVGTSGGFRVQVRLGHRFVEGPYERAFFGQLEYLGRRAVMRRRQARVRDALQDPVDRRDAWLRSGGFETLLALPTAALAPMPGLRLNPGAGRLVFGHDVVIPAP